MSFFLFASRIRVVAVLLALLTGVASCQSSDSSASTQPTVVWLDYAYYNPLSLLIKEKGWLEQDLAKQNLKVEWVLSQGSNKALEFLNANSIDFGSTAGAALLGKANGNPIQSVYIYAKPEWTALVTRADLPIRTVADLKGKRVAATCGIDPTFSYCAPSIRPGSARRTLS